MFPGDGGEPDLSGKPEKLPGMKSFHGEKVGTNNARKSILASKGVGGDIHIRKSRGGEKKFRYWHHTMRRRRKGEDNIIKDC